MASTHGCPKGEAVDDNIYQRMSRHDAERIKRLTNDMGHFKNCRHYQRTGDKTFHCRKYGTRRDCNGCWTCPNCSGLMYQYHRKLSVMRDLELQKSITYITQSKSCMICGAYIEQHYVSFTEQLKPQKGSEQCEVQGCSHTAYEGKTHEENGTTYRVCISHANRMKSWRQHPTKTDLHKPILEMDGRLIDNPNYMLKQERKK